MIENIYMTNIHNRYLSCIESLENEGHTKFPFTYMSIHMYVFVRLSPLVNQPLWVIVLAEHPV